VACGQQLRDVRAELTQDSTVISGHAPPGDPASTLNWQALATANTTLVIMMGSPLCPRSLRS
jgi:uroporphyrin-III C-methyltransferase